MQPSKVYFTDFRCREGVSQQMKLEKLLLAAGFEIGRASCRERV